MEMEFILDYFLLRRLLTVETAVKGSPFLEILEKGDFLIYEN